MSKHKHISKGLILTRDGNPATGAVGNSGSQTNSQEPVQPNVNVTIDASAALRDLNQQRNQNSPVVDVNTEREKIRNEENTRIREILAIAKRHKIAAELAQQYINEGRSLDEFRQAVLAKIGTAKPVETEPEIGMSADEIRNYSFVRAIMAAATKDWRKAGLELRASEAMAKLLRREAQGFFVPADVMFKRELVVGTAGAGGNLVAENLLAGSFIEMLRNRLLVNQLGAMILSGLIGDVAIPSQTGGATAYWVAESTDVTESDPAFGQVELKPKAVGAVTAMSRKLLNQSSPDVENLVRNDLQAVIATAIDLAAIAGTGSGNQPTGIIYTSGIGSVVGGTNGLAPTWAHILELESDVSVANADLGNLAYLTNAKVRGKLKGTEKVASSGQFIWGDNPGAPGFGSMNGYKAGVSSQVPSNLTKGTSTSVCSAIIFGNFADLIIGFWSGLDILVDPYTYGSKGSLKIVALQDCDIAVRHAVSFSAMLDALTA